MITIGIVLLGVVILASGLLTVFVFAVKMLIEWLNGLRTRAVGGE